MLLFPNLFKTLANQYQALSSNSARLLKDIPSPTHWKAALNNSSYPQRELGMLPMRSWSWPQLLSTGSWTLLLAAALELNTSTSSSLPAPYKAQVP